MKLCIENIDKHPAIQIISDSAEIPEHYIDGSSIDNWNKYYTQVISQGHDYKFVRNEIKKLYNLTTWALMTISEKTVCCDCFIATLTERNIIYDINAQLQLGLLFHNNSCESRYYRFGKCNSEMYNRLTKAQSQEIVNDLNDSKMLAARYMQFGIEGTIEGDVEGLFDYIESRAGTSYATTGFSSKAFIPIGYANMTAFAVRIMEILKLGI